MARLLRSKSSGHIKVVPPPPPSSYYDSDNEEEEEDEEEEEEEDYYEDEVLENEYDDMILRNHSSDIDEVKRERTRNRNSNGNGNQFPILDILVTALRKSLVTCSVETDDVCSMDISSPINVRHVSHVTFDRFNGFLGLPTEFEPEVPTKVPSASVSVFGVSAKSMQCSFDDRGNSVPTILLMMQKRLYSEGGLKAEGIFRINAENSQEEFVRNQLNRGVVPQGIDVHCLAGLIKAWLRELPTGVLDSLTPEQVMCCNTEEDCTQLVKLLPPVEAGILDWAITLMADVVQYEMYNKMNARNIAMVFAPNMTQMADPLTALIHAVQVMNLLKTLILKILRERDESDATQSQSSCLDSPNHETYMTSSNSKSGKSAKQPSNVEPTSNDKICTNSDRIDPKPCEKFQSFEEKRDEEEEYHSASGTSTPNRYETGGLQREGYESSDWLNLRKGVRKLCRHPVFQLSKPIKKTRTFGVVSCKY